MEGVRGRWLLREQNQLGLGHRRVRDEEIGQIGHIGRGRHKSGGRSLKRWRSCGQDRVLRTAAIGALTLNIHGKNMPIRKEEKERV